LSPAHFCSWSFKELVPYTGLVAPRPKPNPVPGTDTNLDDLDADVLPAPKRVDKGKAKAINPPEDLNHPKVC